MGYFRCVLWSGLVTRQQTIWPQNWNPDTILISYPSFHVENKTTIASKHTNVLHKGVRNLMKQVSSILTSSFPRFILKHHVGIELRDPSNCQQTGPWNKLEEIVKNSLPTRKLLRLLQLLSLHRVPCRSFLRSKVLRNSRHKNWVKT